MIRRLYTLTRFLLGSLIRSLSGTLYIIFALAYTWLLFLNHATPDADYYILVVAVFGVMTTFLVTLSIAAKANRAESYPLLARLPSRVEFMVAVLISSLFYASLVQFLVALLALRSGPELGFLHILDIPPLWFSLNILAAVVALHASDFVTAGWSRVYLFGLLTIFLFGSSGAGTLARWLSGRFLALSSWLFQRGWPGIAGSFNNASSWFSSNGSDALSNALGFIFWPFRALADAVIAGQFSATQALAPAILLLYATILFVLAADLFATKDLYLTE